MRIYRIVDFTIPADHRVKLKESEKRDKCLDLAWVLKKLWDMKVTMIPIVIGALSTVTKRIGTGTGKLRDKRLSGDHPDYSILRSARILRRVLETWGEWFLSNSIEKPSANTGMKNSEKSKIIILILLLLIIIIYQQPYTKETEWFWTKIWQPKNMTKRLNR